MNLLFKIENLSFYFQDKDESLFSYFNLAIPEQKLTLIMGPSGCGKSTLLRFLNRLIDPQSGKIEYRDVPLSAIPVLELRRRISLVSQLRFVPQENTKDFLLYGPNFHGKKIEPPILAHWLSRISLDETVLTKLMTEHSTGEIQRLQLLRAILNEPEILLLDEPTANLDLDTSVKIETLITDIVKTFDISVLWVTHDPNLSSRLGVEPIRLENKVGFHE